MTTYKSNLVSFARKSGEVNTMLVDKREQYKIDPDGNYVPLGIRLNIVERAKLVDLKDVIDRILEDCKNDGY